MSNERKNDNVFRHARILVLDDENAVRRLYARWLTEAGCSCCEARDTAQAWELLRRENIDLMILDVRMPMDWGVDLVHQFKQDFPDLAILMVTGVDAAVQAVKALTRGACGYLIKPIDRENLLFHVQTGLEGRERHMAERDYVRQLEERLSENRNGFPHCAPSDGRKRRVAY
jgi:DNA-binding NtrC family response regulator